MPKSSIGIHSVEIAEKAVDLKEVAERIKSYFLPDDFVLNDKEDFEREIKVYYKKITGQDATADIIELIYQKII